MRHSRGVSKPEDEAEKIPNLRNRRIDWRKMNRCSDTCGTISDIYVICIPKGE